jgi:hypothetical protein
VRLSQKRRRRGEERKRGSDSFLISRILELVLMVGSSYVSLLRATEELQIFMVFALLV